MLKSCGNFVYSQFKALGKNCVRLSTVWREAWLSLSSKWTNCLVLLCEIHSFSARFSQAEIRRLSLLISYFSPLSTASTIYITNYKKKDR